MKISKSIVYRLIRTGELEAINIVAGDGELPQKGHYRVKRADLSEYLANKTTKDRSGGERQKSSAPTRLKVANHLEL